MTDGFKKITKIKLEKIEERIKKLENFHLNLKKFRDRESNSEDSNIQTELIGDKVSQKKILPYKDSNSLSSSTMGKKGKKIIEEKSSLIGNNGFNIDVKRYFPLTILREYYFHAIIIVLFLCGVVVLIYYVSITMIQDINKLLFIQKFIYGKLIACSSQIVEMKCFISNCGNTTNLDYSDLKSYTEIRKLIIGIKSFKEINYFYNNKYLLDACDAAIDKNIDEERYQICLNDTIINSANNTDNLIKLIDNIIDCEMKNGHGGVHAKAQVAHFDTEARMAADKFAIAMNMHLPPDIRVLFSEECDPLFHARFSAKRKTYRYTVQLGPHADVFLRTTSLHLHYMPDEKAMQKAAGYVIGTHDFNAFKCADSAMENTVRTIERSEWTRDGNLLVYTVEGNGFLYNMVRILVGTMLEIGSGKRKPEDLLNAINNGNRKDAGATAPAHGLCLCRVVYPDFDTEEVLHRG